MAATIDWATRVISIDRASMTLVQSSPTEIRELNLNEFRLNLKDLEDDPEGMVFPTTHTHNTEVLLGGIVYARVIEMINDYTITFENGFYAVNLVGANSNVGDVVNLNNVSIRSANAAGLISNSAIEYSSFNGGVTVDIVNGTDGTVFPQGTPRSPVKSVIDAVSISQFRGFSTLFVKGDLILDTGDNVTDYQLVGDNVNKTLIDVRDGALVSGVEIIDSTVTGLFDGKASFKSCTLLDISFVEAEISECTLKGIIILEGVGNTIIEDCRDGLLLTTISPTVNFNNSGHNLAIRDYHGDLNLRNKSQNGSVEINMNSGGRIILEPTVSNGSIRLTGTLELQDNSTGTTEVDSTQVIYPEFQQLSSFDGAVHINTLTGVSGTKFPIGTKKLPVNNINDAGLISNRIGFSKFTLNGSLTVIGKNLDAYTIEGNDMTAVLIFVADTGNSTINTTFRNIGITGQLNGYVYGERCAIQELSNIGSNTFPTVFSECIIRSDDIKSALSLKNGLTTPQNIHFFDCASASLDVDINTIDFNNSTSSVGFRNFAGSLEVINYTGGQESTISLLDGGLTLNASNTNGTIVAKADELIDTSNGLTVVYNTSSGGGASVWTTQEKQESLAYVKKASDNAEQVNLKIT